MRRRRLLRGGAAVAGSLGIAGCLSSLGFETQSAWRDPPLVEDRPDGVYYPAIVEGMGMYGTVDAGRLRFALMHSYPHRFWNLTGTRDRKVVVRSDDSLHLMATVWDADTGTILPVDLSVEITDGGDSVAETNLWPMLSPNMGFHYGDNLALPGEGTYEATLQVGPLQMGRTAPFESQFTEASAATLEFTFDTSETYNLEIQRLGDRAGTEGSVDLTDMSGVPASTVPAKSDLPGRFVGERTADDALFYATVVDGDSQFSAGSEPSLLVSPRTPYNRVMLPRMSLAATVRRDQTTAFEGPLRATLDPALGCFYRASTGRLESGDSVRLRVQSPPQLSRHDGYETAFIDMPAMQFTV